MTPQVDMASFRLALVEMGHRPEDYAGQRLSLAGMADLYELEEDIIMEAIEAKRIGAHYDYLNDTIWVDALDAAYFFFCLRNEAHLYSRNP